MNPRILTTLASTSDYWANKYQREATQAQTETIKWVGIGVVVALVILILVVAVKKSSKRPPVNQDNDSELKAQLKELLEQNKKLADKVEKLEQENNKKGKK
jgi:uncharacterized protein YlxW (UPF0749 family)